MKGIVFTELIEMVETKIGHQVADRMIETANTVTDGAFTAVGTYDHKELLQMVVALSEETGTPVNALVRTFGNHLFHRLRELYPNFFEGVSSALDFLPSVQELVHVEVKKLYPDAELPEFDWQPDGDNYVMTYRSARPFADLAEGMVQACVEHFGDGYHVHRQDMEAQVGNAARFTLAPINQKAMAS